MTTEFKKNLLIQGGNSTVAQHLIALDAIKRVGEPEDVANAISFLLSEKVLSLQAKLYLWMEG